MNANDRFLSGCTQNKSKQFKSAPLPSFWAGPKAGQVRTGSHQSTHPQRARARGRILRPTQRAPPPAGFQSGFHRKGQSFNSGFSARAGYQRGYQLKGGAKYEPVRAEAP